MCRQLRRAIVELLTTSTATLLFCCQHVAAASQTSATVTFTPAPSASSVSGLSQPLTPAFAGVGIEPSNLISFTGASSPNQLSINLLTNLANFTGVPPYIRLGGNTQDYMIYEPSLEGYYVQSNPKPTGQGAIASDSLLFGPSYFAALDRFPTGTPITFGLNLAYEGTGHGGYLSNIVNEAEAARSNMKNVQLTAFEIGNEPDLYLQNGFRTGSWDGTEYGSEWEERANAVWQQVLLPNGYRSTFFEPGTTASTIGTSFQIDLLDSSDVNATANGTNTGFINAWSQHDYYFYVGVSTYYLTLDMMMDLSTTAQQFSAWTVQVQEALATGKPFVLREMASVGPVGLQGISDTFGAALWTLNFFLYTASINISSVEMHMTDNSYAAPWQPASIPQLSSAPHVRPSYYAFAAMAQVIGTSCTSQVVSLNITTFPTNYLNRLAVYATYQSGSLASLVMLNTQQANSTQTSFSNATFSFHLPALVNTRIFLSYLTAAGADSTSDVLFNGISYEQSTYGTPTVVNSNEEFIDIPSSGNIQITVRDSQAIIANVGSLLGSNTDISGTNCANLAATPTIAAAGQTAQATYSVSTSVAASAATPTGINDYNSNSQVQPGKTNAGAPPAAGAPMARVAAVGALVAAVVLLE